MVNLDIKQTAPDVEPYEALLAAELRSHGRADDVIVASFSDVAMAAFRNEGPEFATSLATMETAEFYRAVKTDGEVPPTPGVALQIPTAFGGMTIVDEALVGGPSRGLAVHVWTINEADEMRRLVALGVDGIISDTPSVLAGVLRETGGAWESSGLS